MVVGLLAESMRLRGVKFGLLAARFLGRQLLQGKVVRYNEAMGSVCCILLRELCLPPFCDKFC